MTRHMMRERNVEEEEEEEGDNRTFKLFGELREPPAGY